MENEKEIAGNENQVETATTEENESNNNEIQQEEQEVNEVKTFTQEQVNEFVRQRIERERNSIYKRYGVNDRNELDNLVGKSQAYDIIKERFDELTNKNNELQKEFAYLKNGVDPNKKSDIEAYFKGKELEINDENMANEIGTHPEWKIKKTIEKISADREVQKKEKSEKEIAKELFGF